MKRQTFKDLELHVAGCTFVASGYIVDEEIEFLSVGVLNQPDADADTLLTAIKIPVRHSTQVMDGWYLLEQAVHEAFVGFYD